MAESEDAKTFDVSRAAPPAKRLKTDANKPQPNAAAPIEPKNTTVHGLPPMLSPTLPACIEEQLAKLRGGDAQPTKKADFKTPMPSKSPRPLSDTRKTENSDGKLDKRNSKVESGGNQTSAPPKQTTSAQSTQATGVRLKTQGSNERRAENTEQAPKSKTVETEASKAHMNGRKPNGNIDASRVVDGRVGQDNKKKLIVRIKIPKSLRRNCQRILKMQSRPKKVATKSQTATPLACVERSQERTRSNGTDGHEAQQRRLINGDDNRGKSEVVGKPKTAATASQTPKSGEKRQQPDGDKDLSQPSSKRHKPSSIDLKRPHTPVGSALKSPSIPQLGSAQKSHLSTPKQVLKSAKMSRIGSAEGDVKTPLGSMRGNTPIAPSSAERSQNREARSSSNVSVTNAAVHVNKDDPANKIDDAASYKTEFNKYADMARSLKRGADALAKLNDGQINTDSVARRQGLAIAIEATLCYMLAFTLKDEPSRIKHVPCDRAAWVSLLPYFKFLKSVTRDTDSQQLQGLFYQLEAVCRDTIHQYDLERLEREATSGEDSNHEFATFCKQSAENGRLSRQAWADGTSLLTISNLRREFPKTWDKRSEDPIRKERLTSKSYREGGFYLPLSNTSTVMEAVRAGWSILDEWTKKEGVKWDGKMGL